MLVNLRIDLNFDSIGKQTNKQRNKQNKNDQQIWTTIRLKILSKR